MQTAREERRERLERGVKALADYTENPRYLGVVHNFDVSWDNLGRYISEYERVMDAWAQFIRRSDLT